MALTFKKEKPRYCSRSGRKLFLYWCRSCRKFHWPYMLLDLPRDKKMTAQDLINILRKNPKDIVFLRYANLRLDRDDEIGENVDEEICALTPDAVREDEGRITFCADLCEPE